MSSFYVFGSIMIEAHYIIYCNYLKASNERKLKLHYFPYVIEGKRHDNAMLADSKLPDALRQFAFSPTVDNQCVFLEILLIL